MGGDVGDGSAVVRKSGDDKGTGHGALFTAHLSSIHILSHVIPFGLNSRHSSGFTTISLLRVVAEHGPLGRIGLGSNFTLPNDPLQSSWARHLEFFVSVRRIKTIRVVVNIKW